MHTLVRFVPPMVLLLAGVVAGCSRESFPSAPSITPVSSRELRTTFYWEHSLPPQNGNFPYERGKFSSSVVIIGRASSRGAWVDVGDVRLAGMEIPQSYSQNDGIYSYTRYWDNLLWDESGAEPRTLLLEVAGTSDFPSFTDTIPVTILEPSITFPYLYSRIMASEGFVLKWRSRSAGGKVQVRFLGPDGGVQDRSGWVPDTGELMVEPDMTEGMKSGLWRIQIERTENYQKALPGGGRSIVSITARYIAAFSVRN